MAERLSKQLDSIPDYANSACRPAIEKGRGALLNLRDYQIRFKPQGSFDTPQQLQRALFEEDVGRKFECYTLKFISPAGRSMLKAVAVAAPAEDGLLCSWLCLICANRLRREEVRNGGEAHHWLDCPVVSQVRERGAITTNPGDFSVDEPGKVYLLTGVRSKYDLDHVKREAAGLVWDSSWKDLKEDVDR